MKLKRYNLGFGFFGPLEQHANGKLMKAEEADKAMAAMLADVLQAQAESEAYHRTVKAMNAVANTQREKIQELESQYKDVTAMYRREAASANFYFVLNIILLAATICGETYRYFSGN